MGIAALHPSYKSGSATIIESQDGETRKFRMSVDFVLDAHFGLNPDIAPCSFRVPRAERFPPECRMRH